MADHDWAALYHQLDTATAEYERSELVELLRDLIRDLVVEALPTGAPTAASPDLSSLDFPRLITWLKRNLSLPELGLFEVDGDRVLVEADGPRVLGGDSMGRPTAAWPAAAPLPAPTAPYPAAEPQRAAGPAPQRAGQGAPAQQQSATRQAEAEAKKAADKLSPGFRGLEFD